MYTKVKRLSYSFCNWTSVAVLAFVSVLVYANTGATVSAAAVTNKKDTLSTSAPGVDANHTIQFITPTAVTQGMTIILDVDTLGTGDQFDLTSLAFGDFDVAEDTDGTPTSCSGTLTDETLAGSQGASAWGVGVNTTTDTITLTAPSNSATYIAAGACIVIEIGTHATSGTTGTNQINNPSKTAAAGTADINDIAISGSFGNTGSMLVATIEGVSVSVTIAESLSFTMAGVASGSCTSDTGSPTVIDTFGSATTVPFGTASSSNSFYTACQLMSISTNATSGYIMTASENQSLLSNTDTIDDTTCDAAACTESTGAAWATATNNGLGFWCQEATNTSCTDAGDSTTEHRQFACTGADAVCDGGTGAETAQNVMQTTAPANNDQGRIHYKLSVSGTQPAGSYSNTITYIATPTF